MDGICPDFVCANGRKQLIELDGEYWHRGKDPQERVDRFAKFGFYCLVIQCNELKDEAMLHKKIEGFVNSYPHKVGLVRQCYYLLKKLGLRFRKTNYLEGESTNSTRMKRLWQDPVYREKIRIANIGKHLTEEAKQKISLANIGNHHTKEARQRMSIAQKARRANERKGSDTYATNLVG